MAMIPNRLHFIWVGTNIPERNVRNMLKWVLENVLYECFLWTETKQIDNSVQSVLEVLATMEEEGKITGANMRFESRGMCIDIDTPDYVPFSLHVASIWSLNPVADTQMIMVEELEGTRNYGAASDILRMWVLYELGGIYSDFDVFSNDSPLPLCINAPNEILFAATNVARGSIMNCFIAASQKSDKVYRMLEDMRKGYRNYISEEKEGGVWSLGDIALGMQSDLDTFRAKVEETKDNPEVQKYWKEKLCGVLSLPTVSRTGPMFFYRWLQVREGVDRYAGDMLAYMFQIQAGYELRITFDNSWMK